MIVASSPCYPYGIIDNIEEIAKIALSRNIPLHVDACLGGLTIPFWDKLGYNKKRWNFQVEGVTSISADIHKYGFAHKGCSVIGYISQEYLNYQYFTAAYWPGGLYASPSMVGSRGGGIIAQAWGSLVHLGEEGFLKANKMMNKVFTHLVEGINEIPNLSVVGEPDICCIGFHSQVLNIMDVCDLMEEKGWKNITRLQKPLAGQIVVAYLERFDPNKFLSDLRESASVVNKGEFTGWSQGIYGMTNKIPSFSGIVDEVLCSFLETLYSGKEENENKDKTE